MSALHRRDGDIVPLRHIALSTSKPSASLAPPSAKQTTATEGDSSAAEKKALRQVRSLFLTCQNIVSLSHIQHLDEMTGLRSLSLHMNLVRRIEGLEHLRQLVELDLSGNEIRVITPECFRGQSHLARLNLSSNYLTSLPDGAFACLPSLQWLSLAYNGLVSVKNGLASIPRVAPLAYVDLCGNRIEHLEEVTEGLAAHREHIKELRLQTPQQLLSGVPVGAAAAAAAAGGGDALASAPADPGRLAALPPFATGPALRENPLCSETFPLPDSANARMSYVEKTLQCFPKLTVLNGVSFGVDPIQAIMKHEQEQQKRYAREREEAEKAEQRMQKELERQKELIRRLHEEQQQQQQQMPLRSAKKLTFAYGDSSRSPTDPHDTSHSMHFVTPDRDDEDEKDEGEEADGSRRRHRHRSSSRRRHPRAVALSFASAQSPPSQQERQQQPSSMPSTGHSPSPLAALRSPDTHATAPAVASPSSGNKLRWRPKRVSRGTNTEEREPVCDAVASAEEKKEQAEQEETRRSLTLQLQRAHEQLQLRAAMEEDLRRHLDTQAQRVQVLETEKASMRTQGEQRVSALKDELLRRAAEVTIMKKTARANLEEQAAAMETHWREVLATHTAEWERTLADKDEALAAMQGKAADTERQCATLSDELREWKAAYQELRTRCEAAVTELSDMKHRLAREKRQQQVFRAACTALADEEMQGRLALERSAWAASQDLVDRLLHEAAEEGACRLEEWTQYKETWEAYALSLQQHYKEVLQHAQSEASVLREELEQLKAVDQPRAAEDEGAKQQQRDGADARRARAVVDMACDPILPPEAPPVKAERKEGNKEDSDGVRETKAVASPITPGESVDPACSGDPLYAATTYWRDVAARQKDELARLQAALQLSESTTTAIAAENKRLVTQLDALHTEQQRLQHGEKEEWLAERSNLLRALHNLQEDVGKKDAALDALEEEARSKIESKRQTIVELKEQMEELAESSRRATENAVQCRDALATAQHELEKKQREAQHLAELTATQEQQLKSLQQQLTQLQQQGGGFPSGAERRQVELEQARLVSALTVAREQLVRLHQSHCELTAERSRLAAALATSEKEVEDGRRRLKDALESGKQKQRATWEALAKMMSISDDA